MNKRFISQVYRPAGGFFSLLFAAVLLMGLGACSNKKKGDQPVLDSVYVMKYMHSKPQFKEVSYWAEQFYSNRDYKLGWFKEHELVPQAKKLVEAIDRVGEEGLDPQSYKIVDLQGLLKKFENRGNDRAGRDKLEKELDVALSATYFVWANDYYRGLLNPGETKKNDWDIKRNRMKLHLGLMAVLGERESSLPFSEFKPAHEQYAYLKKALANYRNVKKNGGWPAIPANARVSKGESSDVVPLLRQRLAAFLLKDSTKVEGNDRAFDDELAMALKRYQEQNGLKSGAGLTSETIKSMNIPVDDRIRQIIINMERWRWIPQKFEPNYLIVNIPEYSLRVYEAGKEKMKMDVVVGKELHETPVFNDRMEHVVLSPYWNIPPGILKNEIAPVAARNPAYLASRDMEVVDDKGNTVDPSSVNWSAAGTTGFPYIVRRKPGPQNDLGGVKFIFPNSMNIYLHDTPHGEIFNLAKRDFSHGCVRVEKPIDLAVYLLRDVPGWDRSKIESQIATRQEKYVPLKEKLPVYLVYFTAVADAEGHVRFYDDIYGHDKKLKAMYFNKL